MKKLIKLFGIIAFVAVIGFSMAACKDIDSSQSINGTWESNNGTGTRVSVSGDKGVIKTLGSYSALWTNAVSKGYVKVGSTFWQDLTRTSDYTWSGKELLVQYNTSSPNVATGTTYSSPFTFTLSADGKTLTTYYTTWTRK